jgi:hypothetical protein
MRGPNYSRMGSTLRDQAIPVQPTGCPRCGGPAESLASLAGVLGEAYELTRCRDAAGASGCRTSESPLLSVDDEAQYQK